MNDKKIDILELTWVFVVGSFTGFIIETFWHLIKYHEYINKQGLLYGPFKPIYGLGAVLITLLFYKKDNNYLKIFCLGTILGTIYEYMCSVFQEYVLKTSTWSYKDFSWNINGRIYLPYCLAWGLICIIWIYFIYPYIKEILNRMPEKMYKNISTFLLVFMVINIFLTTTAVFRTSKRNSDYSTYVFRVIDNYYNDEYMHKKFPKMNYVKK
ncbi:MAG: putative ABC transporter permease [Bacilli bacterium]|nr:putative ABC transporter permease [Bacilli bacterium]